VARFLVRRTLWACWLFVVTTLVTYVIFFLVPSFDPSAVAGGAGATPLHAQQVRHFLGLDEPLWKHYGKFVWNIVAHGSLGLSWYYRVNVTYLVGQRAPITMSLVFGGAVIWLLISVPVGVLSALRPRSLLDRFAMLFVLVGISAHPIWIGLILAYVFGYTLGWTPIAGYCNFFGGGLNGCNGPSQWTYHMLLPWATFTLLFAALYVRLIRASVMETLSEDYVRTARAKGAPARRILLHHVLRNSLLPIVTILGMDIGLALGGAIFTETVFDLHGLGQQLLISYNTNDLPMIVGIVVFGTVAVIVFNLVVDVAYAFLDPRIELG
jgi:peptide/nickel transport system permease protein